MYKFKIHDFMVHEDHSQFPQGALSLNAALPSHSHCWWSDSPLPIRHSSPYRRGGSAIGRARMLPNPQSCRLMRNPWDFNTQTHRWHQLLILLNIKPLDISIQSIPVGGFEKNTGAGRRKVLVR